MNAIGLRSILLTTCAMALLAAPALAGKSRLAPAKQPVVDEVSKLDLGASYGLKARKVTQPADADPVIASTKPLSENQVGKIVRERSDDLEYCWLRLPAGKRVVSAAVLHLSIAATGKVASVEVNGDLPAGVGKCITSAASRWTFPIADAATEIDHGIMLTTTSQR